MEAVESRVLNHELNFDYPTKIKIIFELVKQDYDGVELEQRQAIAEWLKDHTSPATKNLNLRLLFTCYEMYLYDKKTWKNYALKLMKTNKEFELVIQGLSEYAWCDKTGKHRSKYYRYKRSLPKKNCVCGELMGFFDKECETCENIRIKKETEERNIEYRKQEKIREAKREAFKEEQKKKDKVKFVLWKKENSEDLKTDYENQKEEFGEDPDEVISFEDYCESCWEQQATSYY